MNLKKIASSAWKFTVDPSYRFQKLNHKGFYNQMPDEEFLKKSFKANVGYDLDLDNPKTFNAKLQWLKLYDRKPEYTRMVDKYEAKEYVAGKIGSQYIIPTLGVWDKFEDIDFDALPDRFVLKCTHDSGGLAICTDKTTFDKAAAARKINRSLQNNFYYRHREWPYKDVKPRIIAEEYKDLENLQGVEYKLFCFNGKLKMILVCKGKAHATGVRTNDFLDENFNRIPVRSLNPNSSGELVCPAEMPEMKRIAEYLSENIPVLRVDFYLLEGKIYFGELTFFHNSGMCAFTPAEYDRTFGDWIELPAK